MLSFLKMLFSKDPAEEFDQKIDPKSTLETQEETESEKPKYLHPWIEPEDYDARVCFWDGRKEDDVDIHSEAVIYDWIVKKLSDDYYCFPHVSLREIFRMKDDSDKYYLRFLAPFHVDYLFVNRNSGAPVVAVELDGKHHDTDKKQKDADDFKNRLFKKNHIPLIRIRIDDKESSSIFEEIVDALDVINLYNRSDYRDMVICTECKKKMYARRRRDGKGSFLYCNNCKNEYGKNLTVSWDLFHEIHIPDIFVSLK